MKVWEGRGGSGCGRVRVWEGRGGWGCGRVRVGVCKGMVYKGGHSHTHTVVTATIEVIKKRAWTSPFLVLDFFDLEHIQPVVPVEINVLKPGWVQAIASPKV